MPIKEELDKLTKEYNPVQNQYNPKENCQPQTQKPTSNASFNFCCPFCKKLFRYKLALKKHICPKSNNNDVQPPAPCSSAINSTRQNSSSSSSLMAPVKSTRPSVSTSEEEEPDESMNEGNTDPTKTLMLRDNIYGSNSDRDTNIKKRGRPMGFARLPRIPVSRGVFGSGVCPDCGESYPNKEILKLHTCKSYLGLETENTYRADRQNVELVSRTTQRRSLEESPPVSPDRRQKKKRRHRSSRNRSRSTSSPKRSRSKSGTKSGDADTDSNLNSHVSTTSEDDECKTSCSGYNIKPLEIYPTASFKSTHKTILSSINSECQIQESSETSDNGSIITRAIQSLDNEMAQSSPTDPKDNRDKLSIGKHIENYATNLCSEVPYSDRYSNNLNDNHSTSSSSSDAMSNENRTTKNPARKIVEDFLSCEQCGKPFLDQNLLTDHILEEHDSDPFG